MAAVARFADAGPPGSASNETEGIIVVSHGGGMVVVTAQVRGVVVQIAYQPADAIGLADLIVEGARRASACGGS